MQCSKCQSEIKVYELYPRSYRLYVYVCKECGNGFLAHHFDLNLEIYQMESVTVKKSGDLLFIVGLRTDPRIFDNQINPDDEVVVITNNDKALGELALTNPAAFIPYKEKNLRILKRILNLESASLQEDLTKEVFKKWKRSI